MATRPTATLPWANSTPGNVVAPSGGLITTGYLPSQKPAAFNFNYIVNLIFQWIVWFDFNTGTGGGGGGGSALDWQESGSIAPTPINENNLSVYEFDNGLSQSLYAVLEIPPGYNAGSAIHIYNRIYSPDSTGTLLFQTVTTLIRTGTDPMTSTTNQRTSTNSALTLSGGTVNVPQQVIYDLTDSSGNVNGVAVSAGDILIIQLTRGTDTATSSARCIQGATIPTFS